MYNLEHFKEQDHQRIIQFIKENPFAFLAGCSADNKPVATQVPVFIDEIDGKMFLSGHIMKNTDHHKAFSSNSSILAVFTSPHSYVSASWYTDKKQGSTWNYMSVHVRGHLKFLDEPALIETLRRTTNHFENNPHSGANFEDLSSEYVNKMIKAIVAFQIEVEQFEHVFKLSQNRDRESFENIIHHLENQDGGGRYIAGQMRERKEELYKDDQE